MTRALDGETTGFPLVAQAALIRRERVGQKPETVALLTSRPPAELSLAQWHEANINHWGIETGLHARLDASRHDDTCRLRTPKGQWIHGMFNRWANSLFRHWSEHRLNGHHMKTSDFIARMAKNHDERAVRALTSRSFPS